MNNTTCPLGEAPDHHITFFHQIPNIIPTVYDLSAPVSESSRFPGAHLSRTQCFSLGGSIPFYRFGFLGENHTTPLNQAVQMRIDI